MARKGLVGKFNECFELEMFAVIWVMAGVKILSFLYRKDVIKRATLTRPQNIKRGFYFISLLIQFFFLFWFLFCNLR